MGNWNHKILYLIEGTDLLILMQSVFEKCGTKDVYCLPPRTWLHDIWAVGLVVDCEHIRDTNGIPACFAFLCGVACRHRLEKKKACKRSHDLSEQVVMEFRNLHEEKLRKAGALALERREKEAAKIPATRYNDSFLSN